MSYLMEYFIKNGGMRLFETDGLRFFLLLVMTVLSIVIVLYLAAYLCKGIGLYTMAKRENKPHPWLAFIPIARYYLQGELCGDIEIGKKKVRDVGIWLVVIPFLYQILYNLVVVLFFFAWVVMGFSYAGMNGGSRFAGSLGFSAALLITIIAGFATIFLEALYKTVFILVNQRIFGKYTSGTMRTVHAVLSALVPMYEAVVYLVLRNRSEYGTEAVSEAEPEAAAEPEIVRKPDTMEPDSVEESDTAAGPETTEES